ncbi:MAG: hypothetical protein UT09_C0012G0008 [Parcubacteria group bacterium GW2011_GWF2_38_8]|nr:MAG: hypothetical protein UT09_C0012G0008 [Parcubacteria group bacterium GW2011_GWF2_38_8]
MINYNVPFYSNTPEGTHCFQAVLKMVLKYFLSQEEYSFEELDKKTAKVKGLWTWKMAGLLWLKKKGFKIENIGMFDYKRFSEEGEKYLIDFYGEEIGEAQITHCKVSQEMDNAKKFVEEIQSEKRVPEIKEIINFLNNEYLVVCVVNSRALNNISGYSGHFILIKGYENNSFIVHDPGLPRQENRKVDFDLFEESWGYPNQNAKNIISLKI